MGKEGSVRYEETQYGFSYGSLDITRIHSDDKKGWVILQLKTPKSRIQVYATKTGKLRLFDELNTGAEYSPPTKNALGNQRRV